MACDLAVEARDRAGRPDVRIAGALPPLRGSYRADLVGPREEIEPAYREQAEILAPYVDLLLCETMSSAAEGLACATAACSTGKPVWVSWTLHEDRSGRLRSGETVAEAVAALRGCRSRATWRTAVPPESITAAMAALAASGVRASAVTPTPSPPCLRTGRSPAAAHRMG
jgi:S-methylmethionine-dependent homocysteine/selenocysteine methylase